MLRNKGVTEEKIVLTAKPGGESQWKKKDNSIFWTPRFNR